MRTLTITPRGPFSGGVKRAIQEVLDAMEILDNAVVFPRSIEAEYGSFMAGSSVLIGTKMGGGRGSYVNSYTSGWLFNTSRKFTPQEKVPSSELPFSPAPYRLEIDTPGSGMIELPGYRLRNGILLLYTTPSYEFRFPGDVLTVGGLEDYAQLSVKTLENGFEGEVTPSLKKGKYVEVAVRGKAVEDIAFFKEGPGTFTYEFLKEPLLMVSHERVLSPQKLQKAMDGFIGLSGHGEFSLILRMGRKSSKEMKFTVELGE
ncbi:hypothetical protein [Thermococcus sp.]|uniref:hypothetical protein n=1 Tax=Thermococcus sp. TaxID=35749 RepID=UPI0025EFA2C4|nr:hypothetical protein [Thermococcus sp.]